MRYTFLAGRRGDSAQFSFPNIQVVLFDPGCIIRVSERVLVKRPNDAELHNPVAFARNCGPGTRLGPRPPERLCHTLSPDHATLALPEDRFRLQARVGGSASAIIRNALLPRFSKNRRLQR